MGRLQLLLGCRVQESLVSSEAKSLQCSPHSASGDRRCLYSTSNQTVLRRAVRRMLQRARLQAIRRATLGNGTAIFLCSAPAVSRLDLIAYRLLRCECSSPANIAQVCLRCAELEKMKSSCPNCGGTSFDVSIKNVEPWARTKCQSCQAVVEVSDTTAHPAKLRLISVPTDDDEGDD